ncbi:Acetyl-coenzyme A carboxylase carboxyl transferase subunit alpha [Planctomycetes bacterium Poly30]|uniref:Acetyl-coenzyme A carboxylase carboxyl transferase subunit alpha n=1 Tax=Saltatorellus ferox TaxID=2528018 RepID=A0A518ERL7_9BACT|nr:Acetyl-coenzyme A carboxylase carboxyl transferase subunit alpha [Planctomycetes bacterium Poly30]
MANDDKKPDTESSSASESDGRATQVAVGGASSGTVGESPSPTSIPAGLPFERDIQEMERKLADLEYQAGDDLDITAEVDALRKKLRKRLADTYEGLSAWDQVTVARHPDRPVTGDYIREALDDFVELHGDKAYGDDPAIVTGLGRIGKRRFMLVGHRKGRTTKERLKCNFGCAHPEGYRKALRKMQLAERMGLPIVTMINTPGAYPGIGAEERGQAAAIAENILRMFEFKVPIVAYVIGEGGSGGALGIGIADRVLMLQYSYYSVISPEGCAAILWKDGSRSPEAAEALGLTAGILSKIGLIDGVVEEPLGGAHRDRPRMIQAMRSSIVEQLTALESVPRGELVAGRRQKFRYLGAIEGRFPVVV